MKKKELARGIASFCTIAALAIFSIGCGAKEDAPAGGGDSKVVHPADVQPPADAPVIEQAPASQPAAEGESAALCPVSGEEIGGHGDPVKVMVEGKEITVCCDGCVKPLKEDPKKYLTSL